MTNQEFIESIRLKNEEWRDVSGYEGLYMISSFGRVLGFSRKIKIFYGQIMDTKTKIMSPYLTGRGYYSVTLSKDGETKRKYIHRLVAEAFIPNYEHKTQIDHIDGNKTNNKKENLRWCTNSENQLNPITSKKKSATRTGKECPKLFVPIVAIDEEKNVIHFKSFKEAEQYGFDKSNIHKVLKGEYNQHKGYRWMYLSDYNSLINQDVNELSPMQ